MHDISYNCLHLTGGNMIVPWLEPLCVCVSGGGGLCFHFALNYDPTWL